MNWITIVWSMIASAALTLGVINLVIWAKQRAQIAHLAFVLIAFSVASIAGIELVMTRAQTAQQFGEAMRWSHVPVFFGIVGIVWFVRAFLGSGRLWLAWTVCIIRFLSLVINFLADVNVNYGRIIAYHRVDLWGGESIGVAEGVVNPWMRFAQLSLLLLVAYVIDAGLTVWRRGDRNARRRAVVVGGSIAAFVLISGTHWALVVQGLIVSPFIVGPTFLLVVIAMGYELSLDVTRAQQLGTELRISTRQLYSVEQRVDLAANAAGLAFWEWDIARDEVWLNERGREIFGYTPDERINLDRFMDRVHAEDRDRARTALNEAVHGAGASELEFRTARPELGVRWVAGRGRVEFARDGKPLLMRGVSIDITARKQAELQMEQDRIALRHMSRVSTLGQLSASIAHQLNQPLAAILGNAEAARQMLAREPVDLAELREICDDIVSEDHRAAEVIRRLRELYQRGETKREVLDINALVRETLALVTAELLTRHVAVVTDLAPKLPLIDAGRVQLQQVLINLVLNAADAMAANAEDERIVTISSEVTGADLLLTVVDRGSGIADENMKKIFDAFWSSKDGGMGMGLAICHLIVVAHGGSISAANNRGSGATFSVTLPLQQPA